LELSVFGKALQQQRTLLIQAVTMSHKRMSTMEPTSSLPAPSWASPQFARVQLGGTDQAWFKCHAFVLFPRVYGRFYLERS
jgi:hypothetical protein